MIGTEMRRKNDACAESHYNRFNRIYDADYILVRKMQEGQANAHRLWFYGNCIHIKPDLYVGIKTNWKGISQGCNYGEVRQ